jgi:prepilin-type N-terminal cleavage/methylation domain-containing protein
MRRAAARGGFTLIEMMAAVAIFALLAALVAPRVGSVTSRTLHLRAERIGTQLELARQRAVLTGIRHRLFVDLDQGSYRVEWWVTEAEALGLDPEPPPALDLRGLTPIPMAPARQAERSFRPLPGLQGRTQWLEDSLAFAGLETQAGWLERGQVSIEFATDGTATYTALYLDDDSGRTLVLDVLPLADTIRISDATT